MSINKKRAKVTSLSMPRDKVIKGNHYTVTDFLEILQCSEFMAHVFRKTKWHWIGANLSSCIVLEGNTYKIPADTSLCCLSLEGSVCMFVSCCLYNTGYTTAVYNTTYFTVKKKKKKKESYSLLTRAHGEVFCTLYISVHADHHHRGGTKRTPRPFLDKHTSRFVHVSVFHRASLTHLLGHLHYFFHTSTQNFFLIFITTKYLSKLDCKTRYSMSTFTQEKTVKQNKILAEGRFSLSEVFISLAGSSVLQQAAGVKEKRRVDTKPFCSVLLLRCLLMPPVQHWTLVSFRTSSYLRQISVTKSECWWSLKLWSQCSLKIRESKYNDKTEFKNKKKEQMTGQKTYCRIK